MSVSGVRSKDTPELLRGNIALHEEGYSQRTIASRLRLSRKAVRNTIKSPTSHRGRYGKRRLSTPRQDRLLKVLVTKDPPATSAQLIAQQVSETGDAMSARTVRRRLQEDFQLVLVLVNQRKCHC